MAEHALPATVVTVPGLLRSLREDLPAAVLEVHPVLSPSAANRTESSVAFAGSLPGLHDIENDPGGSHESTRPQSASLPSACRSKTRPPTCSSKTTSTISASPIEYLSSGHQLPISRVNTSNARSGLHCTTSVLWTGSIAV